jgi:hypothetical protein
MLSHVYWTVMTSRIKKLPLTNLISLSSTTYRRSVTMPETTQTDVPATLKRESYIRKKEAVSYI